MFADALSRGLVEGGVEARRLGKARLDIGHIYAYAFASPQAGVYNGDEYSFIHNIVNPEDVVPRLPPSSFGFAHYGYEHFLSLSPEKENEILARFKEEGIDLVPPVFVAMSLDIVHVLDPKRRFKEDFGDTGGQKGFIDRIHGLIEERLSRENYARFVEKGAADLAELVDEQSKAPYRRLLSFFKMVLDGLSEHYGVFSLLNKLTSEKTAWKSLLQPSVSKAIESFPELEEKEEEILTSIAALLHFLCPTTKELLAIYPSLREAENLSAILFAHEAIRYYMLLLGSME